MAAKIRDLGTKAKSLKADPQSLLIAGEDFEGGCEDFELLRDAESKTRQAIDQDYLETIKAHGAQRPVRIIMRNIDGRTGRHPIVVTGRRTVRHVREVNRTCDLGLQVEVVVISARVTGMSLWVAARVENHPGKPETNAQRIQYVALATMRNMSKEAICRLLQVTDAKFDVLNRLSKSNLHEAVENALDADELSLSGCALLAAKGVQEQREILASLRGEGKALSVGNIRRQLSDSGASKARVRPSASAMRQILKEADRFDSLGIKPSDVLKWALGDIEKGHPIHGFISPE